MENQKKVVPTKDFLQFRHEMKQDLGQRFGEHNVCPLWGNQNAKIVHISQAPSVSVIKNQKPFTDMSGKRLREKWYCVSEDVFYDKSNFYFTAIGMYFPGKDKKGGDKKPSFETAKKWLVKELKYLDPQIYLIVGSLAAKFFFPKEPFPNLVFTDQEINGKKAFVLPHPSPINIKWYKDNPSFEKIRIKKIRSHIHNALKPV